MSKTNSPLYRRRQARGLSMDDAYAISEAGRDRVTETIGLQTGGLGTALQEALEKGRKAKGERDAAAKKAAETARQNDDNLKNNAGKNENETDIPGGDDTGGTGTGSETTVSPLETTPIEAKDSNERVYTDRMAWDNLTATQKVQKEREGITNYAEFHAAADKWRKDNPNYINIATKDDKRDKEKSTEWTGLEGDPGTAREKQVPLNLSGLVPPLKMSRQSPLDRRPTGRTARFRQEAASVYGTGPIPVGSDDSSQYEEGKTFVEKEYRLAGASFMGNAAIEGYNMAVDKRNYEKQVDADMLDYVNGATKGLDVPATGISVLDRSISESAIEMKKKFFNHQKERSQWAAEGRLAEWNTKNDQYKNFSTETKGLLDSLRSGITEIGEKLKNGEIDENASDPAGKSLFTSFYSGDAEIGIVNTENGPALMGATKHNDPVNIMARSIQDTLRGLQFIPKQEPMEFYNDFMTRLNNNKVFGVEKQATVLPNGNEVMAYNSAGLENALNVYIKEELKDPNDLRGYASALLGWSYGQYDAVVDAGKDPKEIVANKMREDMDGMLSNVKGYRSESQTTVSAIKEREGVNIRSEQRKSDSAAAKTNTINDLVRAEKGVRSEGGGIVYDGKSGPVLVNDRKTFFTAFPEIKKLEGKGGIEEIKVEDGQITVFRQKKDPMTFLLSEGIETVQQNLRNIAEDVKYIGTPKLEGAPHLK